MRFLLGVLVGYSMRGKKTLLITVLGTAAVIVFIVLPAIALFPSLLCPYNANAYHGQLKHAFPHSKD